LIEEIIIKRPDRVEADRFQNYPFAAIEEAVVNTVYPCGYEIREPIEIRVLPDSITVVSFPGPDRSIRLADEPLCSSCLRLDMLLTSNSKPQPFDRLRVNHISIRHSARDGHPLSLIQVLKFSNNGRRGF
jgi:hypothetical protein